MNIQVLTVGFLRLISLVLLYFVCVFSINLIYSISLTDWSAALMTTIALVFLISATILFWFFPVQFSDKLFHGVDASSPYLKLNINQLVHAGIILFSLTLFVLALIELAKWFIYYEIMNFPPEMNQGSILKMGLLNIIIQLVISALLLAKSYWVTKFLLKLNSPEGNPHQDD